MTLRARFSYIALAILSAACASPGATYKSGVSPKTFDRPPFYAGASVDAPRVAHLPIRYQRGAEQPASFEPSAKDGSPAAALLGEMNRYLDSLGKSARLVVKSPEVGTAPDVRFGCTVDLLGDCVDEGESNGVNRRLELAVGRPSLDWVTWLGTTVDSATVDHALVITLEIGQYWPRQRGFGLSKEIELGTGYSMAVPWLTSLENPIAVVQLTGALVSRDGRAVRIGAEGMLAKRANIVVSAVGGQMLVTDDDLTKLRSLRREDLAGQPLVWEVALRSLVEQLTGPMSSRA